MDWSNIIISACTIIGTFITIGSLLSKKFNKLENKIDERFNKIDERFEKIDERFEKIDARLNSIDQRISRLEGSFDERGHWEGRFFSSKNDVKEN